VEDLDWTTAKHAIYLSEKYAAWQDYTTDPTGDGIYSCACRLNQPMRMTQAELEAHPQWQGFSQESENHPPLRGWLAAPLTGRDGQNIGLIQLSDKYTGEFTESDEDILVQLAQMASVAIENTRLYEAEQHARTQAESANRIKDEFLAVLSHELRSPLNPILGWSRLMRNRKLDEHTISCALETIERNAKLQTQLIEDLLDVSRILQGKMSLSIVPDDLVTTIDSAMEIVRLAAEAKSIDLSVEIPDNPDQKTASPSPCSFTVLGDPNRLQQVMWNLLSNAVKFTPAGGAVRIKLESNNSQVKVTVTDTGKGIEPEFLPHMFEYFRQEDGATTRKFGGLGLGLAIVRHIIELHGGTIYADSPGADQGSTFVVQLPLLKQRQKTMAGDRNLPQSLDGISALEGLQILVVDDDRDSRDLIQFVLEQMGAIVTSVESAMAALQSLAQSSYDVLISDIGMPEVDGYMLMHQVQSFYSNRNAQIPEQVVIPKAIALTAYAGEYNRQRAIKAGFQNHLSKPVEPGELIQTILNLTQ
jgi:signal transduction histidine kinase/ActR/RegA family two-component response regulator